MAESSRPGAGGPDRGGAPVTRRLPLLRVAERTVSPEVLPDRYRIREEDGRHLACLEAPTLRVRVEPGKAVAASAARSAAPGTIFLDGAAQAPPFLNVETNVFNLDHHQGCVRPFTLSTCEQAYVVVSKGLDLHSREWTIWASEPDLDTLLAIWVFLNYRRVRQGDPGLLAKLLPLLRLEGVIDVHGFELRHFCALPKELENEVFAQLETLGKLEAELKEREEWSTHDALSYTADRMRALDGLLYEAADFEGLHEIEELARAELPGQKLVLACRASGGIYRLEQQLRETYGDRLGLIALQKDNRHYTLRQVDSFSRHKLDRVYERLNLLDPAAGNSQSRYQWGGSSDIGGSPRGRGTRLTARQIVEACRDACRETTLAHRLKALLAGAVLSGAAATIGTLPLALSDSPGPKAHLLSSGAILLISIAFLGALWHGPGYAGLRKPVGYRWLLAVPLAVVAAALGGSWGRPLAASVSLETLAGGLIASLAAEVLFRSVIYGHLLSTAGRPSRAGSLALWGSALSYGLWTAVPLFQLSGASWLHHPTFLPPSAWAFLASLLLGLALGFVREKSESLWPPLTLHAVLAVAVIAF